MSLKIGFIGAFNENLGVSGGQITASLNILNSNISSFVDWVLIDSTQNSLDRSFISRSISSFKRFVLLFKILVRNKPDAFLIFSASGFSFFEKSFAVLLCRVFGVPVIFALRGSGIKRYGVFMRFVVALLCVPASRIALQSEYWVGFYLELPFIKREKIITIPNIMKVDHTFHMSDISVYQSKEFLVCYVGWIHKLKGVFDLIKLAHYVKSSDIECNFKIVGEGPDLNNLILLAKEMDVYDIIEFTGWKERGEVDAILRTSSAFIFPTYGEGFPNALIEAISKGVPVMASDVDSIPDLISHRETGMLFHPGDVEGMYNCLIDLYNSEELRISIARSAFIKCIQKYSEERVVKILLTEINNLVKT